MVVGLDKTPDTWHSVIWSAFNKARSLALFASNNLSERLFFFLYVATSHKSKTGLQVSSTLLRRQGKSSEKRILQGDVMWSGPVLNLLLRPAETDGRLNSDFTSCSRRLVCELWVRNNLQHWGKKKQQKKKRPPKNLVVTTAWNYPSAPCVKHDRWSLWWQQDAPLHPPWHCLKLTHLHQLPKTQSWCVFFLF